LVTGETTMMYRPGVPPEISLVEANGELGQINSLGRVRRC
jgi:hypothetical protein